MMSFWIISKKEHYQIISIKSMLCDEVRSSGSRELGFFVDK
jgi:hypothetical protein